MYGAFFITQRALSVNTVKVCVRAWRWTAQDVRHLALSVIVKGRATDRTLLQREVEREEPMVGMREVEAGGSRILCPSACDQSRETDVTMPG